MRVVLGIAILVVCGFAASEFYGWGSAGGGSSIASTHSAPGLPTSPRARQVKPPLVLPDFAVDVTRIIGKKRSAVRKYMGQPESKNAREDAFSLDHGYEAHATYEGGIGAWVSIRLRDGDLLAGDDLGRVLKWAGL